jgi:hypothetical protein
MRVGPDRSPLESHKLSAVNPAEAMVRADDESILVGCGFVGGGVEVAEVAVASAVYCSMLRCMHTDVSLDSYGLNRGTSTKP